MNELVEQFLIESRELVEQATADLLALEENPGDVERLDGAFRAFHTLKGSAGIVDFSAMAIAAHAAEDGLASVRSGKAKLSRSLVSNSLSCLNAIVQWLNLMQVGGKIPAGADEEAQIIVSRFRASDGSAKQDVANSADVLSQARDKLGDNARALLEAQCALLENERHHGSISILLSVGQVVTNVLRSAGRRDELADFERIIGETGASEDRASLVREIRSLLGASANPAQITSAIPDTSARVLRVDVERIDALVKLTGELTVAKNAIGHASRLALERADPDALAKLLTEQHAQIGRLIEELQRSVLGIRVLPLRQVFNRFPGLVREIAENLSKPVRLVMEGEATEADKAVVENLFEPLLHIIRNALDHGVENPDERVAKSKPATATLVLRASRLGEVVLVEVEDDGRGIDVSRVRFLAAERGVMEPEALSLMADEDVIDLVFAAGFSTAEKVTDLSGRGVGMDVVRRNVERLGGTARIASRAGKGTTVTLRLPFSVMMTRVLTVEAGGQTFGIPMESVVETVRIPRTRISAIGASRAFVHRDRTVPVIELGRTLGQDRSGEMPPEANLVVVTISGQVGSVEVDRFGDRMDVMLTPLDGLLARMPGVAGTSLLGDGGVLIVLDLPDLLQ